METKEKFERAYQMIGKATNILLVTHGKPDGDAVSSIGAMMHYLEGREKAWRAYSLGPIPKQLDFLPLSERIETDKARIDFAAFDLIIALDCGSLNRTNLVAEIKGRRPDQLTIEFDHHQKMDSYSDLEIRIPEAASTTEVLYYFFRYNRIRIDRRLADYILTGILTDTGNFLYPSTTEKTVNIASEMLLSGARYPRITEETWRNKSMNAMKLWGRAIGSLEINKRYNFAVAVLTREDMEECQGSEEEMEGISGFLSNLYGVNGLLLLREASNGMIKGSLRTSLPDVDISLLARYLGGGGHKAASGFMLPGHLERHGQGWRIVDKTGELG